jgi:peptidoglycan/LPS O-acetylase OafA/YrhL
MLCVAGVGVALGMRLVFMWSGSSVLNYVAYINTLTRMDGLLAGACVALVVRNHGLLEVVRKHIPLTLVSVATGLCVLVWEGHHTWNDQCVIVLGRLLLTIGFACIVLLAYLGNGRKSFFDRVLGLPPLTAMGKYSYGIYVYQGFALLAGMHVLRRYSPPGSRPFALLVGTCWLFTVLIIAFASYHLFEKRFLRMGMPLSERVRVGSTRVLRETRQ